MADTGTENREMTRSTALFVFMVLALPFYLNDFSNIFVKDWRLWWFIDFTSVKLFQFLAASWLLRKRIFKPADFGLTLQRFLPFIGVAAAMTLIGVVLDLNGLPLFQKLFGSQPVGGMPEITNPVWVWIDLVAALALVGVFEELVFRACAHKLLSLFTPNSFLIIIISSILFGLIHWSGGLHSIVNTAIIGGVFMAFYIKTRSAPALMLAHFLIDFISFSGLLPRYWFIFVK